MTRRQQKYVAFSDFICRAGMIELPLAIEAYQHARASRGADRKRRFSPHTIEAEVVAVKNLSRRTGDVVSITGDQAARAQARIDAGQRLIDLEWPRLTCLRSTWFQSNKRNVTSLFC